MKEATTHTAVAVHPQSTLRGTLICSWHTGTALYNTYVAGQGQGRSQTFQNEGAARGAQG